jgi:hypothetical protein
MFIDSQSANPEIHALAIRIAKRCTDIIRPLLRQEEVGDALNEFYRACRTELETKRPPVNPSSN